MPPQKAKSNALVSICAAKRAVKRSLTARACCFGKAWSALFFRGKPGLLKDFIQFLVRQVFAVRFVVDDEQENVLVAKRAATLGEGN